MARHILILNRWDNEFGQYHRYIDHAVDRVAYLVTAAGRGPLDGTLAEEIVTVPDLGDVDDLAVRAKELVARHGAFSHILALSEFDLETAAALRVQLGVDGKTVEEILRVRDKVAMKECIAAAGLRVPRFGPADSPDAVRTFAASSGFPLVLKPRSGADSQGVLVVGSAAELEHILADHPLSEYEYEEYIDGNLYQVDGVVSGGRLRTIRSWRCLGSCLDFAEGSPFGSVANDDADFERRVTSYTERVLAALGLTDEVFHLEVFRTGGQATPDDEYADIVFLEIGARAGGGQVRFVWREVYGVDLIEASIKVQLGEPMPVPAMDLGTVAGYLMMPEPPVRPAVVNRVSSLMGRVRDMYTEALPPVGAVLDGNGGARHTAGAFRFRAPSAARVEQAIATAVALYELSWAPATALDDAGG
jgi:hypothetical protein